MRADELSRAIEKELEEYLHQTTETVVEAVDAVTDEAIATLKSTSPKRSGRYAKGWTSKETSSTSTGKTKTIHNRTPGLTHLLENGYAKQNGGHVSGRPHIGSVEQKAVQALEKKIRGKL
ncbi:UNVERIFIED_CONTAM: HK97 gp10 family phage protein [Streptococcus canis]|uniref:HK97 gp10 family phage protein n=1 Tax=Streptococcus canis TaxID=1329 RepID=A0AAE4QA66_STRCB|nr:HK97 gp10 family phage protein [Streptococcus canis]MDV5977891.1 HK97 gp10 family phage protein [Streptococcus canis]